MQTIGQLPAGDYYVGDPCYIFPDDDEWREFLAEMNAKMGNDYEAIIFEYRGQRCFVSPTNTGDGRYFDQHRNAYDVDAGLIGAIPAAVHGGGFKFDKPFKVAVTPGRWLRRKRIRIGNIAIDT